MSRIVVCMDCPNYEKGGYCRHLRKDVGALAQACDHAKELNQKFNPEDNEETMTKLAPQSKTKTCTKCGRELPISEFYAKTGAKDGLQTICKECHNAKTKESVARRKAQAEAAKQEKPKTTAKPKDTVEKLTEAVAGITNGLKAITDRTLVDELRARGWTVTCTRTITEEL